MSVNPNSDYVIFNETAVTEVSQKIFSLEDLVTHLNKYRRILENLTPNKVGVLEPLVILTESGFTIALAVKLRRQGALFTGGDIEESERAEILEKIRDAEKIAIDSIHTGKKVARIASKQKMSRESLKKEWKGVPDENIARKAFDQERNSPFTVDFASSSVNLGSNLKNPKYVYSDQKITFTQCMVIENLSSGQFEINTPDYLKTNDNSLIQNNSIVVQCDQTSDNHFLLLLAQFFNAKFEFEAIIGEEIESGKAILLISNVDHENIFNKIDSQLTSFKENLSLDF